MSDKVATLVICQHNTGLSQMAEVYLNKSYAARCSWKAPAWNRPRLSIR